MNKKVLSIVVPSYNAEQYLPETIPTMLSISNLDKLEIIIVNDGSKDNTLAMAQNLQLEYPDTIVIVDKENGGHGSTINSGIQVATGKYFKVVDADDWVESDNLSKLIEYLDSVDDDEVISPFIRVYTDLDKEVLYEYSIKNSKLTYLYDNFLKEADELPLMHSITIKTSILRDNNIKIDENCFYVDLEYNVFPMPYIKTVSYFDLPVYRYRLGSPTQSVSISSYIKNIKMHEKVILSLVRFYNGYTSISKVKDNLLKSLILDVIARHSNIFLARDDVKQAKKDFIEFETRLNEESPFFANNTLAKKLYLIRLSKNYLFSIIGFIYRKRIVRL